MARAVFSKPRHSPTASREPTSASTARRSWNKGAGICSVPIDFDRNRPWEISALLTNHGRLGIDPARTAWVTLRTAMALSHLSRPAAAGSGRRRALSVPGRPHWLGDLFNRVLAEVLVV